MQVTSDPRPKWLSQADVGSPMIELQGEKIGDVGAVQLAGAIT
ncbi:hypothetical protein KIPB_014286, partial [Kipferlia bialata]|eukprot:g14286.t1